MKHQLQQLVEEALKDIGISDVVPVIEISGDPKHGEYTTNIALRLSKALRKPPLKIAEELAEIITKHILDTSEKSLPNTQKGSVAQSKKNVSTSLPNGSAIPANSDFSSLEKVEAVAPGFINFFISEAKLSSVVREVLIQEKSFGTSSSVPPLPPDFRQVGAKEKVMVEFAHPNTHKAFHIGHLRNITTGESLIRLMEAVGYDMVRVNYQGDVGMHIAKCLYALLELTPYNKQVKELQRGTFDTNTYHDLIHARVEFLGKAYAAGSAAFEDDHVAKAEIKDLNALIYVAAQRRAREEKLDPGTTDYLALVTTKRYAEEVVYTLWKETRQWSLDYYETIYERVFTTYERLYFESECLAGVDIAKEAVKKRVLKVSDGAIIFDGKPYGLDTRVFVNNMGLPTYEGKELKLASIQSKEFGELYHLMHVLGPEQVSFTQVTFKAEELLGIIKPNVQYHHTYGWVKLKQGKMSSRLGNVVYGEMLLDEAKKAIYEILDINDKKYIENTTNESSRYTKEERDDIAEKAAIAAVKYAFLKVGTNQEIAFDLKESVSFDGDSGPYLLYSYARATSVLRKAESVIARSESPSNVAIPLKYTINIDERNILRLLLFFPELVTKAAGELAPNVIGKFLFELSQAFNLFYQKHPILKGEEATMKFRLALTQAAAITLQNGLKLLGIETVEKM